MIDAMRTALAGWLSDQLQRRVEIPELRRIATGNSRAMWYVALDDGTRLVARVEQGGVFGTSGAEEYRFMLAASRLGCPVATVRWLEPTGTVLGHPFFVMDFLEGAATGRDDRTLSAELADDLVSRLHQLHSTDSTADLGSSVTAETATHAQIERWLGVYRAASQLTIPLLEEAAEWLHRHAPICRQVGIVHGDPGPGNFVHDGQRIIALTDWEFAHLGDPNEDWAYLVTMRGARTMDPGAWLTLFRRVADVALSANDLHYWSVFNAFKGACANITCLQAFRTVNPAPNMVLIGTALHHTYVRQTAQLITAKSATEATR